MSRHAGTAFGLGLALQTQLWFPIETHMTTGAIAIAAADILTLLLIVKALTAGKDLFSFCVNQIPYVTLTTLLFALALTIALIISIEHYGLSRWVFLAKWGGMLFLLAGFLTTTFIFHTLPTTGQAQQTIWLKGLTLSSLFGLAMALWNYIAFWSKWPLPLASPNEEFRGLMANTNALGTWLLINFCLLAALGREMFLKEKHLALAMSALAAGTMLATSRASLIAGAIILAAGLILKRLSLRTALMILGAVALAWTVNQPKFFENITDYIGHGGGGGTGYVEEVVKNAAPRLDERGNTERLATWARAWEMFKESPILGAGLGAYNLEHLKEKGASLIIHSTPLWLLAEMGLFGSLSFAGLVVTILITGWCKENPESLALMFVITAIATASLFNELAYQRGLWMILAILLGLSLRNDARLLQRADG